jgi:hypothetical protein
VTDCVAVAVVVVGLAVVVGWVAVVVGCAVVVVGWVAVVVGCAVVVVGWVAVVVAVVATVPTAEERPSPKALLVPRARKTARHVTRASTPARRVEVRTRR